MFLQHVLLTRGILQTFRTGKQESYTRLLLLHKTHKIHCLRVSVICNFHQPSWNYQFKTLCTSSHCLKQQKGERNEIGVAKENPYANMTTGEKVKEASKDFFYLSFIGFGIVILVSMGYVIYKALVHGDSVYAIYSKAFEKCQNSEEIENIFGAPLKAYGYETGRRRRERISHDFFMVNGVQHLRLLFFIEGPSHVKGTVHVEMRKNENQHFEYYYMMVKSAGIPQRTIVLEDNR